jgi:hypothetical protein
MIDAIRHRYELVPYVYGECRRGVDSGLSLVRPMYHEHPERRAAYEATGQYQFGDQMVVAPVVQPVEDDAMAQVRVWLPAGGWFDVAHGARLPSDGASGAWFERRYLLDEVPVFVPAGTVVPGQRDVRRLDTPSYPNLVVTAYPGPAGAHDLYEDDGTSTGYRTGRSVSMPLSHRTTATRRTVRLGPAEGSYRGWERRRPVEVRFVAEAPPRSVRVGDAEVPWAAYEAEGHWWFDAATATVAVSLPRADLRRGATVTVERATRRARDVAEALLDGYPGLARRLDRASASTRTLLQEDNRRLVGLSQAVDRIARDPSSLEAELTGLREGVRSLDRLLGKYVERWEESESLNPLDPPVASTTLRAARLMLATTVDQFVP